MYNFSLKNLNSTLNTEKNQESRIDYTHGYKHYYRKLRRINNILKESFEQR